MNKLTKPVVLILIASAVVGCNSVPTRDPEFAAVRPRALPAPPPSNGAIYQAGYQMVLFEDVRARRVGDILTVKLVEKTDASKKAETKLDKTNSTTITNPTILGQSALFDLNKLPFGKALPLSSTSDNTLQTSLSSTHDFDGAGESAQNNSLTGDISVTVAEVLPNGNLVVQGEKLLTLNRGHEHIRLSGIVRSQDIAADNTVESTKIADARIVYAGEGEVADTNVIGWLARFFISALLPF